MKLRLGLKAHTVTEVEETSRYMIIHIDRLGNRLLRREEPHPEMAYRFALGVISFTRKYGARRPLAPCALRLRIHRNQSVRSILTAGLDRKPLSQLAEPCPLLEHTNSAEYYANGATPAQCGVILNHQTTEKLHALRLTGMADEYR
jgi:hypothetical protein